MRLAALQPCQPAAPEKRTAPLLAGWLQSHGPRLLAVWPLHKPFHPHPSPAPSLAHSRTHPLTCCYHVKSPYLNQSGQAPRLTPQKPTQRGGSCAAHNIGQLAVDQLQASRQAGRQVRDGMGVTVYAGVRVKIRLCGVGSACIGGVCGCMHASAGSSEQGAAA
jgi:hypothetical protein